MKKSDVLKFVALLLVAIGAGPAFSAVWQWSPSASNNASVDASINWAEGMSPSSVNDSARAMMARLANYRDDISGAVTLGGTAGAYTLTSNQGFDAVPPTGQMLSFVANVTNNSAATLRVDGGTIYPLQSAAGVPVPAGVLVAGSPYTVTFNGTAWVLRDFYGNPYALPLGGMMPYTGASAPNSNFVLPYGQCISRTIYATYFSQVGTTFGACDGTTTFAVPDTRGRSILSQDCLGGPCAGRVASGTFAVASGSETVALSQNNLPNVNLSISGTAASLSSEIIVSTATPIFVSFTSGGSSIGGVFQNGSGISRGQIISTLSGVTSSLSGGVAQQTVNKMSPYLAVNYILRVI